jgi:hypothetical protein
MKLTPLRDPVEVDIPILAANPRHKVVADEVAALEARFAEAERRYRVARARARGQGSPTRSIAERAKDLMAGGTVISSTPAAELAAAEEEMTILRQAIFAARDRLNAIAGEISREVCKRLAPLNREALLNALAAAEGLSEALEANRVLRGRLIGAGYEINECELPTNHFPCAVVLGSPDDVGRSPAWFFKKWLTDKGIQ